jgi:AcrR family transcriptional regulator
VKTEIPTPAPSRRGRPPKTLAPGVNLRDEIVKAAAEEFRDTGFFGTNTNLIARRAGLAPGTFYNYFPDKVAVLLAVYERWLGDEWSIIHALASGAELSSSHFVSRLVPLVLEHHRHWHRLRHALVVLSRDDERVAQARIASRRQQIESVVTLLRRRPGAELRVRVALTLLEFEAVADCVASGDAARLGLEERHLKRHLASSLVALMAST